MSHSTRNLLTPALVYNASMLSGVALASVGAGAQYGWPVGLMAAGALVLAFTVYGAERLLRRAG